MGPVGNEWGVGKTMKALINKLLLRKVTHGLQAGICWNSRGVGMVAVSGIEKQGLPEIKVQLWQAWDGPQGKAALLYGLATEHGLLKIPFNFCLDSESYEIFPNEAADVDKKELASAMKWIIRDRLHCPVDEAVVDCFYIPDPIRVLPQRRVYVVATERKVIQEQLNILRPSRLRLQAIEVPELALNNLMAYLPESKHGVALLYYPPERENGILLIAREGNLYFTRRVRALTESAEESLPLLDMIAGEIQRALDFVEATFTQSAVEVLYLLHDPEREDGLREALAQRLGVRLKRLRAQQFLSAEQEVEDRAFFHLLPALGEALRPVEVEAA
ncbi:hypothetical protein [Candidatus Magnetaquicoccus inordinatus]|uniref:hypothetical protein n=1 Tax=Candidatus Magnetaquicoccus inordinatus TaxID=2496818 RepID=UPI00102B7982|nr:hypothetical protein [Candidatus Magnetaquicoccus inordinatus]